MSNHLAVGTVTAALKWLIGQYLSTDVPGGTVTVKNPADVSATGGAQVNLFLYQVQPNAALRNADMPNRDSAGTLRRRPQAALDLYYLISFFGDFTTYDTDRLLGSTVKALHAHAVLTSTDISSGISGISQLANSDLADQADRIRLTPVDLSLEDLTRLWGTFVQSSYVVSVAWKASVVLIEAQTTPKKALPVRTPLVYATAFQRPLVEAVEHQDGSTTPIEPDSTVVLTGTGVRGDTTKVEINGEQIDPTSANSSRVVVALSSFSADTLRAGVTAVRIAQFYDMGDPEVPHTGAVSNVAAFVLHPKVSNPVVTGTPTSGTVKVDVVPPVGAKQVTRLYLHSATNGSFTLQGGTYDDVNGDITFAFVNVPAGTYIYRLEVDGAESVLETTAGAYSGPTVTIS